MELGVIDARRFPAEPLPTTRQSLRSNHSTETLIRERMRCTINVAAGRTPFIATNQQNIRTRFDFGQAPNQCVPNLRTLACSPRCRI